MYESNKIPCDLMLDSSVCLWLDGYEFIQKRCQKLNTDIFKTRLMGKRVICITGEEACKIFYNNDFFKRKNTAPKRIQKTLFGKGGVQSLDGLDHKIRKEMFLSIMTPENLKILVKYTREQWKYNSWRWNNHEIHLFNEVQMIMCQVACRWAGVPLKFYETKKRAEDLGKMVDGFGGVGLRYYQGKCARKRSEKWIEGIIDQIRSHKLNVIEGSAAYIIAWHRNRFGQLLTKEIAAVELLNILRPITAIATYITFGTHAMLRYPKYRRMFGLRNNDFNQCFVQEVRRYYPFAPFVGARVKTDFLMNNYYFKKNTLVLLDIYGTNHDSRVWDKPYKFRPERFRNKTKQPYSFIPQGGGYDSNGHRCAGELVTIEVMKASLDYIANHMTFEVPNQDLRISLVRIPTLPKSKILLKNVKTLV